MLVDTSSSRRPPSRPERGGGPARGRGARGDCVRARPQPVLDRRDGGAADAPLRRAGRGGAPGGGGVRALLVSPDYASHYLPLSALGQALARRGHDVVVATGPALAGRVSGDGFEHHELVLGPASNPGLARKSAQADEAAHLRAFLAATRRGMVATLRLQAEARQRDLLWEPAAVTERLGEIVADVSPTLVVVGSARLRRDARVARARAAPRLVPSRPSGRDPRAGRALRLPLPPSGAVPRRCEGAGRAAPPLRHGLRALHARRSTTRSVS